MAKPKYLLTAPFFHAPALIPAGKEIEWDGRPNPYMEPLNKEAEEAVEQYYKDRPNAGLGPAEPLPVETAVVVGEKKDEPEPLLSLAEAKASPPAPVK